MGLALFPIVIGLGTASSFGNAAIQIFMLMLVLNYGRKVHIHPLKVRMQARSPNP